MLALQLCFMSVVCFVVCAMLVLQLCFMSVVCFAVCAMFVQAEHVAEPPGLAGG